MYLLGKKRFRRRNENKNLIELFEEFQLENKTKNLSPKTIRSYENNLILFFRFIELEGLTSPSDIHKTVLEHFKRWLLDKDVKHTTINTYLRHTRAFLYWCMGEDYIEDFKIQLIKIDEPQKEPYTDDEIKKLLSPPDLKKCGFVEYRNWIMVNFLLDTGVRLNTLINITVSDVDLENGIVLCSTNKNRKVHYVPISDVLIKLIGKYIKTFDLEKDMYLFPNESAEQLKSRSVQSTISKYNYSRGVYKTSIHAFRHTYAKNYIQQGGSSLKLQRLLGHSTLDITQKYVNLYSNDLKEGYDDVSILNKLNKKNNGFNRKR